MKIDGDTWIFAVDACDAGCFFRERADGDTEYVESAWCWAEMDGDAAAVCAYDG